VSLDGRFYRSELLWHGEHAGAAPAGGTGPLISRAVRTNFAACQHDSGGVPRIGCMEDTPSRAELHGDGPERPPVLTSSPGT
jgi:hypothetical protein